MSDRRQALLEAALMCSRRADALDLPCKRVAADLARRIERLADSPLHSYPPQKRVIDLGQDSENSLFEFSASYEQRYFKTTVL